MAFMAWGELLSFSGIVDLVVVCVEVDAIGFVNWLVVGWIWMVYSSGVIVMVILLCATGRRSPSRPRSVNSFAARTYWNCLRATQASSLHGPSLSGHITANNMDETTIEQPRPSCRGRRGRHAAVLSKTGKQSVRSFVRLAVEHGCW